MDPSLSSFFLKADRSRAVVRALWRLLCAVGFGGLLAQIRPDWRLLWLTQPATCLALGVLALCLAAVTLILVIVAIRWLMLAVWPGPLGVQVTPRRVEMNLGPLGRLGFDWSDIVIDVEQEFDAEILDELPDDSFVPRIRRRGSKEDLARLIQLATNVSDEELTRRFRPYLRAASAGTVSADGADGR